MKTLFTTLAIFLFTMPFFKAQTQNMDFESTTAGTYSASNSVSGWTVSSQQVYTCPRSSSWTAGSPKFNVLTTPIASVSTIGSLAHSPLGGTQIVQLNNMTGTGCATKLSRTFSVTSSNSIFQYAYAALVEGGSHTCCEGAFFKVELFQNGNLQSCFSYTLSPDNGCQSSGSTFSTNASGAAWTNWQTNFINLSQFINSNITIEVSTSDCIFQTHAGTAFFDARMLSLVLGQGLPSIDLPTNLPVHFCAGSNQALLEGPVGYSGYQWHDVNGAIFSGTLRTLPVYAPVSGSVYTLNLTSNSGCVFTATYAIGFSTVSIAAVGSSSTCSAGNIGSATVVPAGSGTGYNYSWTNASNSVIATGAVVNNLLAGTYTITVTSAGNSATCGTATSVVTVSTGTPGLKSILRPFCSNEAYLYPPAGSNYQWYTSNLSAISSSLGGTSSSFTISSPVNLSHITVAYTMNGCRDSLNYVLFSIPGGTVSTLGSLLACPGSTNSSITLSMTPATNTLSAQSFFSVSSTGSTSAYSATLNPLLVNSFTATNLSAGGTYSVVAFDGTCMYSKTFSITPYVFNYTLSPGATTLCSGNTMFSSVSFSSSPGFNQYSYSWSPATFLAGSNSPVVSISPTITPGNPTTIIYTVIVTPSVINCPQSKTVAITVANPLTPTITAVPPLCANAANYTISVSPAGGTFLNGTSFWIGSLSGIFSPSLQSVGVKTFTYANAVGTCIAKSSGSFVINPLPILHISGNTLFCEGQSTTLLANGADTYSWSHGSTNPYTTLSPSVVTSYTLEGSSLSTNCSASTIITLSVVPYPQLSVNGNTLLCPGESATLTAMGAYFYNWDNGSTSYMTVVTPSTNTTYSLTGTTSLASCSSTQAITVSTSDCNFVGLKELNLNDLISVYPNPANVKITIACKKDVSITLLDGLGKIILQEKINEGTHTLDVSNYSSGIYFLKINDGHYSSNLKLIKTD